MPTVEEGIQTLRQAIETSPNHFLPGRLNYLGILLNEKFEETDEIADLEEAIQVTRQAIDLAKNDLDRASYLYSLSGYILQRVRRLHSESGIDEAIQVCTQTIELSAKPAICDPVEERIAYALYVSRLGECLAQRYTSTRCLPDIDEAICLERQALALTPLSHSDRIIFLVHLGTQLNYRYSNRGDAADLDECIGFYRQIIDCTLETDENRPARLNNLSALLRDRFKSSGQEDDVEEATQLMREVIATAGEDHPKAPRWLNNLSNCLGIRYSVTGQLADLEEGISTMKKAIQFIPEDHPELGTWLNNLGVQLSDKYGATSQIADIDEAIELLQKAIDKTPQDHLDHPIYLNNLANHLGDRHSGTGNLRDLDDAITKARQAISLTKESHIQYPIYLSSLGVRLGNRYQRTRDMANLEEAVRILQKAVNMTSPDHPDRAKRLNNLANHLGERSYSTGSLEDLEESIRVAQDAVKITKEDNLYLANWLSDLGVQLCHKYFRIGYIQDLDDAIEATRKSIKVAVEGYHDYAKFLNNLEVQLGERYDRNRAMADLEESIHAGRRAVEITPKDISDRAMYLSNLASQVSHRHGRTGSLKDIDEAIDFARSAVRLTPEGDAKRGPYMHNLAVHLNFKYEATGKLSDLDEAIQFDEIAAVQSPDGHPEKAMYLSSLGGLLNTRYLKLHSTSDLEQAIEVTRRSLKIAPEDHVDRNIFLQNLGNHLGLRYKETGSLADVHEAILLNKTSFNTLNAPTMSRAIAATATLRLGAAVSDWQQACEGAHMVVDVIPKMALHSLETADKQHLMSQVAGITSDAAAVSLQAGEDPTVALRFLEQGRCVLAASLEGMRASLLELRQKHPKLEERFERLRAELDGPSATRSGPLMSATKGSQWQSPPNRRYEAGNNLDALIAVIRGQHGFEDFLLPPKIEEMQAAASLGPIVVVNLSQYRCDAILVEQHRIRSVALPRLDMREIERMSKSHNMGEPQTLERLWVVVARPVLNELGFTQQPSGDAWPRMWWIPTGALTKLPLHAAGHYGYGSSDTVLDRVASSYSTSIRAIIQGRQGGVLNVTPSTENQALLVAIEHTPGMSRLPFATKEVAALRELCKDMSFNPIEPGRCKEDVMSHLPQCKIFHFAGHGYTDINDPLQSFLMLEDWKDDRLTVGALLEMNLRQSTPFLAFLSACGTGQIKDDKFLDESIHLVSAFQLAGFRHVVGSLWQINDEFCVDMAGIMYEEMKKRGMTDDSVCHALHYACRTLRNRKWNEMVMARSRRSGERMPRDADLLDDEDGPQYWVPYVHFGV